MIEKISRIQGFAVFKDFEWDRIVCDKEGNILPFKKLNIIYGRNYSGKTTLSRIIRALETGLIDKTFANPTFLVQFNDGIQSEHHSPCSHGRTIRVFNEDFVRDNLRFITNPDEDIKAFAILGKDNNKLKAEIDEVESELGSDAVGGETGLHGKKKHAWEQMQASENAAKKAEKSLSELLTNKATKGDSSIKYQSELYGDQNYNITKISKDIDVVCKSDFVPISKKEQDSLRTKLKEESRPEVLTQKCPYSDLEPLVADVSSLVTRVISSSSKIDELLRDAIMNRWVSEGRKLHLEDHSTCKFCENRIAPARWLAIEAHFDEESDRLEAAIDELQLKVADAKRAVDARERFDKGAFYFQFQSRVEDVEKRAGKSIRQYLSALNELDSALEARRQDLLNAQPIPTCVDTTQELFRCYEEYNQLVLESNRQSSTLKTDQTKARSALRLSAVHEFVEAIDLKGHKENIKQLSEHAEEAKQKFLEIKNKIELKKRLIDEKRRQLKDEEKGAVRVNALLNGFFGNRFLSLEAIEKNTDDGTKQIRFEVVRNGERAYHLSEGERSLLAFCYFMAKLEEVETAGSKPIIWIDDPISSLDGNHVFFVYSLVNEHLHKTVECEQLFVSTHSLDFLKYLRRLPGATQDKNTKEKRLTCRYLMVERRDDASVLVPMPKYMQDYVTEFNYLFEQIYRCATVTEINDSNYRDFYSFGNNARKFLELYLYYLFPDNSPVEDKFARFFGEDGIPSILVDRLNNEYSHMAGVFERGATPLVQPEMQSCAKLICDRLARNADQYRSLLRSIGKEADLDVSDALNPLTVAAAE